MWAYFQNIGIIRRLRKMLADHEPDELLHPINFLGELREPREPFKYTDPALVSGVLKGVVADDLGKVKQLVAAGKSVNINDNNGNTPLHVAVMKDSPEIVNFLLTRDELIIDSKNFWDETPLLLAVRRGNYNMAKALIDKGADANKGPLYPLHEAVLYPNIARLLIENGAHVNSVDLSNDTPLHDAVINEFLETVCMLLYYNADANAPGNYEVTPFMRAIIAKNQSIQMALLDYVDDFNRITKEGDSTLFLAVRSGSPLLKEMVKRGAKFHKEEYLECYAINNLETFQVLWKCVDPKETTNIGDVIPFLRGLRSEEVEKYTTAIIENEKVMGLFGIHIKLDAFIEIFSKHKLLDLATRFTFIYLMNGYTLQFKDIVSIYQSFHICELFLSLRYFDFQKDYTYHKPLCIIPKLMFRLQDIKFCKSFWETNSKLDLESSLELLVSKHLRQIFQPHIEDTDRKIWPLVPSLVELARNEMIALMVRKFYLKTPSQYYTFVDYLHIPEDYKRILKLEKKMYVIV